MSLKQRVEEDIKTAMKARDELRLSTLRMIRADFLHQEKAVAKGTEFTDDKALARLSTLMKQRREAAESYRSGGREDLAQKEEAEAAIIEQYLPAQASEAEIAAAVEKAMAATGASTPQDAGKAMGKAMAELKALGKSVDGGAVNRAIREKLASKAS
jgi:uncharacterized protein YqeY